MAIFRRARKHPQHQGMSKFKAGLLALVILVIATYFGFTKANPFASPFKLEGVFETASNIQPRSPVRIAGVDVGKVTKVEQIHDSGGARVEMEIKEKGLPIHKDAELKIRPRIFLEGNFFVDIEPGSPSAPTVKDGATIPVNQTATPVQFADVLAALQSDTREDLKTLLFEYAVKGLGGGGAEGFNRSVPYWEPAYKNSALANDATLGTEKTKDIQRVLSGQQKTFAALVEDEEALKGLVTNFNVTAAAFARQDAALEASIPALRDVLRVGSPALASLNSSLPSLRRFAIDALPGVRSSGPTIAASQPFIEQLRRLFSEAELRGLARDLREAIPRLARLNRSTIPFLAQSRSLSACTNETLLPFVRDRIPDPGEPADHNNQQVLAQIQRSFVGLAGESRIFDANTPMFKTQGVPPSKLTRVRPSRPGDGGQLPPEHRPDRPCEIQETPSLAAPGGQFSSLQELVDSIPLVDLPDLPDIPQPPTPGLPGGLLSASTRTPDLSTKEIERLVNDLLDQAKGKAGREEIEKLIQSLEKSGDDLKGSARRQFEQVADGLQKGLAERVAKSRETPARLGVGGVGGTP